MENLQEKRIDIGDYVQISLQDKKANLETIYNFRIVEEGKYNHLDANEVTTISPLGKELISKQVGDCGEFDVLGYQYGYKILEFEKNKQEKKILYFQENLVSNVS